MKKVTNEILALMILFTLTVSCSTQKDFYPGFSVSSDEMNQSIRLVLPPGAMDAFLDSGTIGLVIQNLTDSHITFPSDYNIKILVSSENGWNLVPNDFSYSTHEEILPTKAEYASVLVVFAAPVLSETQKSSTLRIIVFGTKLDTNTQVGAYLDINLDTSKSKPRVLINE